MSDRTKIGFLGLGHMGAAMAERCLAPDIDLYVFDTRQEAMEPFVKRGATACDAMLAMVNAGTGRSMVTGQIMEHVLSGDFAFGGAFAMMDKDARLGLAEATALNVPMWIIEQAARVWRFAMIQGAGNQDVAAIARVMQGSAGVEIRGKKKE